MCRYDGDDYDWYVGSETTVALPADERCEDCGRLVPAGEPIVQFLHADDEYEREEAGHVYCAARPEVLDGRTYLFGNEPGILVLGEFDDDADVLRYDAFDALGFVVDEVSRYDLEDHPPKYSYSCRHCRAGDVWLQKVCHQHVVLVTVHDLEEHRYEYPDAELGRDFCTLETLAGQQWRSKLTGRLIPVEVIDRLARAAAAFANREGLAHA